MEATKKLLDKVEAGFSDKQLICDRIGGQFIKHVAKTPLNISSKWQECVFPDIDNMYSRISHEQFFS